ncbi:hypothetical protein CCM_00681 [Cordyceps militaris CM01]|uniref:Uncharacterized protein n=1 Tax=Cordyceps militaris (strain CM01) TaxID=983644 RepID=G3J5G5_CORMM|nr:uncharacterized protein CCM_00681 [Cordyceps militaris CM01]EGX96026.1 hypothetical protein CCM_00681 [Cordyceps militaris CM01]
MSLSKHTTSLASSRLSGPAQRPVFRPRSIGPTPSSPSPEVGIEFCEQDQESHCSGLAIPTELLRGEACRRKDPIEASVAAGWR